MLVFDKILAGAKCCGFSRVGTSRRLGLRGIVEVGALSPVMGAGERTGELLLDSFGGGGAAGNLKSVGRGQDRCVSSGLEPPVGVEGLASAECGLLCRLWRSRSPLIFPREEVERELVEGAGRIGKR
jgi:hypothetical protein